MMLRHSASYQSLTSFTATVLALASSTSAAVIWMSPASAAVGSPAGCGRLSFASLTCVGSQESAGLSGLALMASEDRRRSEAFGRIRVRAAGHNTDCAGTKG